VPFSIRDWVRNESTDSWLFIVSREDVREEICPLMSMWIGIAVQSAMSLPPNRERRLWMVLDELPYLQELPSLETLLSGGRKYGLAAILGMQSIAQLRKIYGRDGAVALLSNPATRLTLKVGDSETAEFLSKSLGDRHTIRKVSSESQSAGGSKSTSEQHAIEAAVLPSEIMALPDLTGFLRVPGDPIIKKIRLTRRERTALAEPYQDRDLGAPPPVPNVPVAKVNLASAVLDVPDLDGPDLPDL
jgi:type IV secretory pathway TraG/TraD family ATPase VirD4